MKRFIIGAGALALALAPVTASAASFAAREEYASAASERVEGNLYVAAGTASVGAAVGGDLSAVGGTIAVTGSVGGDIAVGGGNVQLLGGVGGDVRAVGGQIAISGRVRGDVAALGGAIHLLPGSVVDGDVAVIGGQLIADGIINGSIRMTGGRLSLNGTVAGPVDVSVSEELAVGPDARIGGALAYKAPKEATIGEGVVRGLVSYEPFHGPRAEGAAKGVAWAVLGLVTAMKTLAYLGLAALVVWRWRRPALDAIQEAATSWGASFGRGLVYLILVPIGAVLLLVSFVGAIPGGLAIAGYVALMPVASVLAGMFLGSLLEKMFRKSPAMSLGWKTALGGVLLYRIVGAVPLLGTLVHLLLFVAMFGVLAHRIQRLLTTRPL